MTILYFPISFLVCLLIVPIFRKIAILLNIVDKPNKRKVHKEAKPYLGGIAIFVSMFIMLYFSNNLDTLDMKLWSIGFLLIAIGIYDDKYDMNAFLKLFFQFAISFYAAYSIGGISSIEIYSLYFYFTPLMGMVIVTIWLVALINAINLIDGLDGLAAGTGLISFITILIIALNSNYAADLITLYVIIGVLFGFLFYNFYPANIFLGDSGAMFIGYLIGITSITNYKTVTATSSILLFLICFLPMLDVVLSFTRRKINGKRAFKADALHFHHRLLLHGYSHSIAVLIMYCFVSIFSLVAVLMSIAPGLKLKILLFIILIGITLFVFEKFYLLSDKYAYISKTLKKIFKGQK